MIVYIIALLGLCTLFALIWLSASIGIMIASIKEVKNPQMDMFEH